MLLLHGSGPLKSTDDLQSRLASGLREYFHLPKSRRPVLVKGTLPSLDSVGVDVSAARVKLSDKPPVPGPARSVRDRFSARELELKAVPLCWEQETELFLHLKGEAVDLVVLKDDQRQNWLSVGGAGHGEVTVEMGAGQLEHLLLSGIRRVASSHGLTIQDGRVSLQKRSARSVGLSIEVQARKAFLKGAVRVSGQLKLDEHLNIHPSALTCSGQGVLGRMAVPFLGPLLEKWEAKSFPLLGHTFGELRCHHLHIEAGAHGALRVQAAFGS